MRRKIMGWAIGAPLALLVVLVTYEAAMVARAKWRTPAVLAGMAERDLPLSAFSKQRIDALLAVDDPGFYTHRGVDFSTPGQGGTTITQALVKRLYFDRFKPGFAKIEQSLIARFVLDPAVSKRDQLEMFVNHAYFGHADGRAITGFADAARTYYRRDFAALDDRQYLGLVAMLMGPNALDPIDHPEANAERIRRIEALLANRCRPQGVNDVTYDGCARV